MNRVIIALALCAAATLQASAQQSAERYVDEDRGPRRQQRRPGVSQALTAAQQARVKAILSKYEASSVSVADARAIHDAFFRQARLRAEGKRSSDHGRSYEHTG